MTQIYFHYTLNLSYVAADTWQHSVAVIVKQDELVNTARGQ